MAIRGPIKKIGRNTVVYGLGNVLSKLSAFFLIPIYTRYLPISEVGILALLEMAEIFLLTIVPLGINNSLWRHLSMAKKEEHKQYIFSAYIGTVIISLILLGLLALNYKAPALFLGLSGSTSRMFLLVILNVFLAFGVRFILSLWQYQEKSLSYIILSVGQFAGVLAVTIILVVFRNWGLLGVLIAKSLVFGLLFVIGGTIILNNYRSALSFSAYKDMLKYGAPLVLFALVTPVLNFSDRLFLKMFISFEEIGIYSIAYKFGMLINMILVVPLQRGWMPMMYQMGVKKDTHEYYRDILFYYAVLGSLIFLAVSLFARGIIETIATPDYLPGIAVIPIVILAYFVNGFRQFFMAGAVLSNRTVRLGIASTIAIGVNLVFNYLLIKQFGMIGAAWSTLFSYLFLSVLIYMISQKIIHIDWAWNRLMKLAGILLLIFFITNKLQLYFSSWDKLLGFGGIVMFIVIIRIAGVIGDREIKGLKSLIRITKV